MFDHLLQDLMVRINRVHTGGGDGGETSLVDGSRVKKSSLRIEVVGTIDELNSFLGVVRMELGRLDEMHSDGRIKTSVQKAAKLGEVAIARVQQELFDLGAELACPNDNVPEGIVLLGDDASQNLIDEMEAWLEKLEPLNSFILPTGEGPVAWLQLTRTVARRLERRLVELDEEDGVRPFSIAYINRLSDWCFVLARWLTSRIGGQEVLWKPIAERGGGEANKARMISGHDDVDSALEDL